MTARPNPASPRAGVMRLSLLTHRTNRATANCLSANRLWVTQTSHDLHPGNRGQTETQSGYPRSPPHRPSGTPAPVGGSISQRHGAQPVLIPHPSEEDTPSSKNGESVAGVGGAAC